MKRINKLIFNFTLILLISYSVNGKSKDKNETLELKNTIKTPQVYLYGEAAHGNKIMYDKELIIWQNFYTNYNMRHLFIETGYSTAQIMNQWMKASDDTLLLQLYENCKGTADYCTDYINFCKTIKQTCPDTIFHGTDVGHQYKTNDSMLLRQLEEKGETESKEYQIVLENIEQAKQFYKNHDYAIRENFMAYNFIREFDSLPKDEKIMGIYGNAHTAFAVDITGKVPSMIAQIRKNYNDDNKQLIQVFNLSLDYYKPPLEINYFSIKDKCYKTIYFGEEDVKGWDDYCVCKTWKIEAPDDYLMKLKRKTAYYYNSYYPTSVNLGDVFRIELIKIDGSKTVKYYRADGKIYDREPSTNLILIE